jgi:hypothetical protein
MEETTEITGRRINPGKTESEYRAIDVDSSSSVKTFADDRYKYYRKYVKGDYVEDEEDSKAVTIGKLVDCLLLEEEQHFDDKFYRSTITKEPTGLMSQFVEALFKKTMECLNESGEVTREMDDLMKEAYNSVKFDKDGKIVAFKKQTYEKTVELFASTDAITYYKEIRQVRPKGMSVITSSLEESANRVVTKLRTSPNTKKLFDPDPDVQVFKQLKIEGLEIDELPLKAMIDLVLVYHERKMIQPFDLKCTWNVEDFYERYYLLRKSYIQAYIYYDALFQRKADLGFDYKDYVIQPPAFIVCDSGSFYEPLIYKLSIQDLNDAYKGFTHKGRTYKGLEQVINELKWAREGNIWNISYENYKANGVVLLNSKKER